MERKSSRDSKQEEPETPEEEIDPDDAHEAEEEIDADDNNADDDNDSSATDQDTDANEPKDAPKKKNTVQERIDELTKARREAEREADRWRAIAEERERSQGKTKETEEPKGSDTTPESDTPKAPDPTDKDKYPLGDLDPQYSADMVDYKLEQRIAELNATQQKSEQQRAEQARAEALLEEWTGKLAAAEESHEDFRETVESLESAFEGVDPQYGQFLAETVMRMEKGPDVLYHLAKNPDDVAKLIASDPVNAALALGRLEASFGGEPTPKRKVKATNAPTPPKNVNKGSATSLSVKPDTDDLDAFENVFFDKK